MPRGGLPVRFLLIPRRVHPIIGRHVAAYHWILLEHLAVLHLVYVLSHCAMWQSTGVFQYSIFYPKELLALQETR